MNQMSDADRKKPVNIWGFQFERRKFFRRSIGI